MRNLEFRALSSVRPNGLFREVPGQGRTTAEPLVHKGSAGKTGEDTPRYEEISRR